VTLTSELELPAPPAHVWRVLTDFRRVAACVPGCESVEEEAPLVRYRAVLRHRVGPFRLDVPLDIRIEDVREPEHIRARAVGRDRTTGTSLSADLTVTLTPRPAGTGLVIATDLQVGGRLAALGYPLIRKRADEAAAEFAERLRATLVES
jgi:carbon monoxide dehydrogenase subunit G